MIAKFCALPLHTGKDRATHTRAEMVADLLYVRLWFLRQHRSPEGFLGVNSHQQHMGISTARNHY